MSDLFELFLLVAALCADAFTASFVYGADHVRIPFVSTVIISSLSAGILAAFLFAGSFLRPFLAPGFARLLCAALLFLLGIGKLLGNPMKEVARRANGQEPEVLSAREAFFLGIALSLDSAAAGIGTGLSGSRYPLLLGMTLLVSVLSITGGCLLGRIISGLSSLDFSRMSGAVLIFLAVLKLI